MMPPAGTLSHSDSLGSNATSHDSGAPGGTYSRQGSMAGSDVTATGAGGGDGSLSRQTSLETADPDQMQQQQKKALRSLSFYNNPSFFNSLEEDDMPTARSMAPSEDHHDHGTADASSAGTTANATDPRDGGAGSDAVDGGPIKHKSGWRSYF